MLTIDDRSPAARSAPTLAGGWNGATRRIGLPGGGVADISVRDGGNCFNVNSVVDGQPGGTLPGGRRACSSSSA